MPSFDSLGVPAPLAASLAARGITEPFPIQTATLPDSLAGRDVLGRGRTGSGKTIAFALPLVTALTGRPRRAGRPTGLVLAPTRELATQIAATVGPLAEAAGLTVTTIFGGVSQRPQEQALRAGADIVVACPGRLEDLLQQRVLTLDDVRVTVLDEADHMADMGFLPGVTRILARTPAGGQRLLFSATLDNGVDKLVTRFLSKPVTHSVDDGRPAVETMAHAVLEVADADGKRRVMEALAGGTDRRILFVRTKHVAKRIAKQLTAVGIPAADLQGNLSQNARERNLGAFADGSIRVLVATDVAARGVHIDDVALVVHVDPPTEHKAYLHRSGRTARAGASGTVVTLVLPEQRREVAQLLRAAGITATPTPVTERSAAVVDLVGEVAPKVAPAPVAAPTHQPRQPKAAGDARRSGGAPRSGGTTRSAGAPRSGDAARSGDSARSGAAARSGGAPRSAGAARSGGGMQAGGAVRSDGASGRAVAGEPRRGGQTGQRHDGPRRPSGESTRGRGGASGRPAYSAGGSRPVWSGGPGATPIEPAREERRGPRRSSRGAGRPGA